MQIIANVRTNMQTSLILGSEHAHKTKTQNLRKSFILMQKTTGKNLDDQTVSKRTVY